MTADVRFRRDGDEVLLEMQSGDEVVELSRMGPAATQRVARWFDESAIAAAESLARQQEARSRIFDGRVEAFKGLVSLGLSSFIFGVAEVTGERGFAWFGLVLVLGSGFVMGKAWGEIQAGKEDLRCAGG